MTIKDQKALDRHRNQLLRRAEAVQRRLDEVTRAAREELISIRDEIRALDSIRETQQIDSTPRAGILDRKTVKVTNAGAGVRTDGVAPPGKVKTILIVEKEPKHSQSLARQTQFAGFKPVVASTAEGGLKKMSECRPDLILLEIELSDLDGLKFISEIRENPKADKIPIVAMSAFPHLKARCLELGCADFLLKPIRMIKLVECARKYLR